MASFPKRLRRSDIGPTLRNRKPVSNPQTDVGAETFNPAFHALAGLCQSGCKAWVLFDGFGHSVIAHGEAWAPNGDGAPPVIDQTALSDGHYRVTYAPTYTDENGIAQAVNLVGGLANGAEDALDHFPSAIVAGVRVYGGNVAYVNTYPATAGSYENVGLIFLALW